MSLEFRNAPIRKEYEEAISVLRQVLFDLPFKIVAIDGRSGVGKTTLGRFLSWRFNVTLIETDNFLITSKCGIQYNHQAIFQIVQHRRQANRPIIIEGILVLRLLKQLDCKPDYHLHLTSEGVEGTTELDCEMESYQREFKPNENANTVIDLPVFE